MAYAGLAPRCVLVSSTLSPQRARMYARSTVQMLRGPARAHASQGLCWSRNAALGGHIISASIQMPQARHGRHTVRDAECLSIMLSTREQRPGACEGADAAGLPGDFVQGWRCYCLSITAASQHWMLPSRTTAYMKQDARVARGWRLGRPGSAAAAAQALQVLVMHARRTQRHQHAGQPAIPAA